MASSAGGGTPVTDFRFTGQKLDLLRAFLLSSCWALRILQSTQSWQHSLSKEQRAIWARRIAEVNG